MVWYNSIKAIKKPRRNFAPEFNACIALEAAKGLKTVNKIAAENELHAVQISQWKTELLDGASTVFGREGTAKKQLETEARDRARLERKSSQR